MKNFKLVYQRRRGSIGAIVIIGFFVIVHITQAAATWQGPSAPLPNIENLDPVIDLGRFVSKSLLQQQPIQGKTCVFNGGNYSAYFGYDNGGATKIGSIGAGATGISSATCIPSAFMPTGNVGVYGFGSGAPSYGVYGVSASGAAVTGSVARAQDFGGYYKGKVVINQSTDAPDAFGSLHAQVSIGAANGIKINSSNGLPSVQIIAGGPVVTNSLGIRGIGSGIPGVFPNYGAGILGLSGSGDFPGISATSMTDTVPVFGTNTAGGNGVSAYYNGSSGVSGTGLIGEVDGSIARGVGVYGRGVDVGVYGKATFNITGTKVDACSHATCDTAALSGKATGVGIFACGTVQAGEFHTNVFVKNSLMMGQWYDTRVQSGAVDIGRFVEPEVKLTGAALTAILAVPACSLCISTLP